MAEMIPDRLPSSASAGERKVFALLQQLPDDLIVYYEPMVADRYPDFIVIIPSVGLLIVEVKGWYPANILKANNVRRHRKLTRSVRDLQAPCSASARISIPTHGYSASTLRVGCIAPKPGRACRQIHISFWSPCGSEQLHTRTVGRARAVGSVSRSKGACSGRA